MLKAWTLDHFKSIAETTELVLAPLTVLVGPNSSGKSTVLQSLLLTAQTLQNTVPSRSVVLNGHILKLGTFADVLSNASDASAITMGFCLESLSDPTALVQAGLGGRYLHLDGHIGTVTCQFTFDVGGDPNQREIALLQPRLAECQLTIDAAEGGKLPEEVVHIRRSNVAPDVRLRQSRVAHESLRAVDLVPLEYEVVRPVTNRGLRRYYGLPRSGRTLGASLFHFLPERLIIVFDAIEEEVDRFMEALLGEGVVSRQISREPFNEVLMNDEVRALIAEAFTALDQEDLPFMRRRQDAMARLRGATSTSRVHDALVTLPAPSRRQVIKRLAEKEEVLRLAARAGRPPSYALASVPLPDRAEAACLYVRYFFSRLVRYLGPLRDEPKPVYPLAGATDTKDVGFRGEHTAAVLELHRNTPVDYVAPESLASIDMPFVQNVSLIRAVRAWLAYLGVAHEVQTTDLGKLGHELKVAVGDQDLLHDLTHVGVGVSQVLPILVLSLLADRGSTLVFEQPELHLHPRVQTRLADFFVSLTLLQKQCLIETHSEYLINQLRLRAALSAGQTVPDNVLVYFVEKRGPHSSYRPIRISEFGSLSEWPAGFFDEGQDTAAGIVSAAMAKRRVSKPNNG